MPYRHCNFIVRFFNDYWLLSICRKKGNSWKIDCVIVVVVVVDWSSSDIIGVTFFFSFLSSIHDLSGSLLRSFADANFGIHDIHFFIFQHVVIFALYFCVLCHWVFSIYFFLVYYSLCRFRTFQNFDQPVFFRMIFIISDNFSVLCFIFMQCSYDLNFYNQPRNLQCP